MDSEPEDEGTQPYEVFPALSRNASPAVMTTIEKMQEDEAQSELMVASLVVSFGKLR